MTTIEKLFVQIFDRKNRIKEQVKLQTDLYSQYLASKLLIDGITPPPWLWNPNCNSESSDPKVFEKEELISELLLPHPQPAVSYSGVYCSLYNKTATVRDNAEVSEGLFRDSHASNKGFIAGSRPTTVSEGNDNDSACALNCVPEVDVCATSPQGKIEMTITNIYNAPDQSLARIQRSKSRQKAIELRKTAEKSHLTDENETRFCPSKISASRKAFQQLDDDNELSELVKCSDMISNKCALKCVIGECLSKEKDANTYDGRISRFRSSCYLSSHEGEFMKLDKSSDIAREDIGKMLKSQSICIDGISKHACLSNTASRRATCLNSGASRKSPLAYSLNSLEGFQLQSISGAIASQVGKADYVAETEVISDGLVEVQAACSESDIDAAGPCQGLEVFVSRPPSDCSMFVKPKTIDFGNMQNCYLNEISSPVLERVRLDRPSEKGCTSVQYATSLVNITFDNPSRKSLDKQSLQRDVSNKTEEALRGSLTSFETCLEECTLVDEGVHKSLDVEMNQKMKPLAMERFESSPKLQGEECELSYDWRDRIETAPLFLRYQNLRPSFVSRLTQHSTIDQGCLVGEVGMADPSSTVLDKHDLVCLDNEIDKRDISGFSCGESKLLEKKSHLGEAGFLECGSFGSLNGEDKNLSTCRIRELQLLETSSMPVMRLRSDTENSWPQFKRRKIHGEQTSFFAPPSFKGKGIHSIGGKTTAEYLKSFRDNLRTDLQVESLPVTLEGDEKSHADKVTDEQMHRNVKYPWTQESEPLTELQLEQDDLCVEGRNWNSETASTSKHIKLRPSPVSSLTKEAAGDSQGCSLQYAGTADTTTILLDVSMQGDELKYGNLLHSESTVALETKDDLAHDERILPEAKPQFEEDGLFSFCSVGSPQDKHLDSTAADRTMPGVEGFIVELEENGQRHMVENAFSFDKLDLPSTTIKRASVLEQLCKSASSHTPLHQFSTTFKWKETPDLYQSVPNGLLEHMDLGSTLNVNGDCTKQHRASYGYVDEVKCPFQGSLYSYCLQFADAPSYWSIKNPPVSPIGRIWDQFSSNSSSSEKQRSFNPELTCFPIEEDPSISISEENENIDDVAGKIQVEISSTLVNCDPEREPLAGITEACVNHPSKSVSATPERFPDRNSLDTMNTDVSFTWKHTRPKQKLGNHHSNKRRCTNDAKENHTMSVSTSSISKDTKAPNNQFSKPIFSGKTSFRKGGQSLSERESKHNNIVSNSNITSFVALVQQKQAAAVGGKRDIKVKALEAAEAAKRLQEKKEKDRKMKKEALKLERARIEQENLQQMELKMKKKEEEQKKREADMAARKRLREEEERREKARKRKRVEESQRHQKELDQKLHVQKVVMGVPFSSIDENVNSGMEASGQSRKYQKLEKERGNDDVMKKPPTEPGVSKIVPSYVRQGVLEDSKIVGYRDDIEQPTSSLTKMAEKDDLVAKKSPEKSYEISPYQCSDDEAEEEDELPTRKFTPSWASKHSVALLLFSQQNVDPGIYFPPESFCSMDEVLQPGKLQPK